MICWECTVKHLAQAFVLYCEMPKYPYHRALAIGHLAEAERECPSHVLSDNIVVVRQRLVDGTMTVDDFELLVKDAYNEWIKSSEG